MLAHLLAGISSGLPSSLKYKLEGLRRPYTFLMCLGQPIAKVKSIAGSVNWEIDELTSQRFLRGTYEEYMQEAFAKFIRPGDIVYDIGAYAGYHSLVCGLLVGSTGRVFAFEPHSLNCQSIERQLELNPGLKITLVPHALSDVCSRVHLDSALGRAQAQLSDSGEVVEAKTVDYLVETEALPPPKLIKIDVEGHEEKVLRGGIKTIEMHRPIVLCDHNDSLTFPIVKEIMTPLDYDVSDGDLITSIPR